jgi:putative YphP/YqiW family bacilliredoxin
MIAQRYPEPFIAPMRAELARLGFEDLKTPDAVEQAVTSRHDDDCGEFRGCASARRVPASRWRSPPASVRTT